MKIATKLTKRVAEFVNEKSGLEYQVLGLFHYPNILDFTGFRKGNHSSVNLFPDYTEVSEQEFIDMVTAELAVKREGVKEHLKDTESKLNTHNSMKKKSRKFDWKKN